MNSIESFLEYLQYERSFSSHTVIAYRNDLFQFIDFLSAECGGRGVEEAVAEDVRMWMMDQIDGGMEKSSMRRKLSTLRTFYRFLQRNKVIERSPMTMIRPPKPSKRLPVFLREAEMDELLDQEVDASDYELQCAQAIVFTLCHTGLRRSELAGLKSVDVDFVARQMKVLGKRAKERIIPFGDELCAVLERYEIKKQEQGFGESPYFFVGKRGLPLSPDAVYRLVKERISNVTSVSKQSPHVLRHTFATSMLNHQAKLTAIKEILGHSSLASTEVYTHVTFEELKKVYNQAHPRA